MSLAATALQVASRVALPLATRGRLTILIFHRVSSEPDLLLKDLWHAELFEERMRALGRAYRVIGLDDAIAGLRRRRLPSRAAVITFDDGYRNNHEIAAPILQKLGMPAAFFIADGYLDGGRMFNDTIIETVRRLPSGTFKLALPTGTLELTLGPLQDRFETLIQLQRSIKYLPPQERMRVVGDLEGLAGCELPSDLMMTSAQVAELARAGFEIGGHTTNHPILASLDDATAEAEVKGNRERLALITGRTPRFFAYPNGAPGKDYRKRDVELVKGIGYEAALTTAPGVVSGETDPWQLPRFTPWDARAGVFEMQLLKNSFRTGALACS